MTISLGGKILLLELGLPDFGVVGACPNIFITANTNKRVIFFFFIFKIWG
ncbi:hypothetical protein RC62_3354 [Flavobacterium aquidurense]|uniref:Uncharacterized protein n=1 Tax=Flavobacterium aquidurense TaxID=362413 RepID=A0A0N8VNK1_9FLAO|nr:hypothetical protein RC62_3354 [Flavobacterium aquidurense]